MMILSQMVGIGSVRTAGGLDGDMMASIMQSMEACLLVRLSHGRPSILMMVTRPL